MFRELIRGWLGEKTATLGMWLTLDEGTYRRIDNVIIPSGNGTTQIDHILVSVHGIFVIETKNLKGWIFGSERDDRWMQVVFGKKHPFQNPLKQNYRHTRCLSEYLGVSHDLMHSVVFFIGECEFKTPMPRNVLNSGLLPYIKGFTSRCMGEDQVERVAARLRSVKQNAPVSRAEHMASLKERHGSDTVCPRCGGRLLQRTARNGAFAGKSFLGCSKYPACRYIKRM